MSADNLSDSEEETYLLSFKKEIKGSKTSFHLSPGGLAKALKYSLSCNCMKITALFSPNLCHSRLWWPGGPSRPITRHYATSLATRWMNFLSALCCEKLLLFNSNLSEIFNEYLKWAWTFSLPPEKQAGKHMGNMQLVLQNNNEASGSFSRNRNESREDILQNLEAYMGWCTVIQHVSKHTQSPSTAWGKLFGIFIVNLWQAHHTATRLPPAGAAANPP